MLRCNSARIQKNLGVFFMKYSEKMTKITFQAESHRLGLLARLKVVLLVHGEFESPFLAFS